MIGRLLWWLLAWVGFRAPAAVVLDGLDVLLAREDL